MARSKKIRGTTTKAGKVTTSPVARPAADRIERPHSGKRPIVKGAQTEVERNALLGAKRGGQGSVKQVGPSNIRDNSRSSRGSVKVVGEGMPADDQAARRGMLVTDPPGRRQPGSVKQVGPGDIGYERLVDRTPSPQLRTMQERYRPKPAGRPIIDSPVLKSGVGRVHPWARFAGQPGSQRGGVKGVGPSGREQTLINGRRRAFRAEPPAPNVDWVTPGKSVVPGS
jgi:hypothetical protein